ncbi:MAG: glutamate--tRNA ligase, partial [Mycobacteriales bacterium]
FGHLPLIVGEDGKPLSKRRGDVSLAWYRAAGYLPEALLNYLALLGWSLPGDREVFTMAEMVAEFSLDRVSHNPARFDARKLEAINGEWIRRLPVDDLARRIAPVLAEAGLGDIVPEQDPALARVLPLAQERMSRLDQAPGLLGYLLVDEAEFRVEEPELLVAEALPVLDAAVQALQGLAAEPGQAAEPAGRWRTEDIKAALSAALVEGLGLPGRKAFGPVRVAVTGRKVSLPLFESMEFLGRERTLGRLRAAIADVRGAGTQDPG